MADFGQVYYQRLARRNGFDEALMTGPDAVAEHSAGFAAAADGNLDADVEHCPGWTVADLVQHLTTTHWFWATIVEEQLSAPPEETRRPAPRQSSR